MFNKSVLIVALIFTTAFAHASVLDFNEQIEEFKNCEGPACEQIYTEDYLDTAEKLSASLETRLTAVAQNESRVWWDTILEGEYIVRGEIFLSDVTAIYKNKQLLAYRIVYGKEAYYTGSCDYDSENEDSLEECTSGSITETALVSPDFKEVEIEYYADFND